MLYEKHPWLVALILSVNSFVMVDVKLSIGRRTLWGWEEICIAGYIVFHHIDTYADKSWSIAIQNSKANLENYLPFLFSYLFLRQNP